jgi:lysozyme family protein
MTITVRDALIALLLQREGGIADVGDGMGLTRFGQTPAWLEQFNLPIPETSEQAAENYAAWIAITGLDAVIGDSADTLADFVIDFAVHSGHQPAIRALQIVLGHLKVDGVMGPKTRGMIDALSVRVGLRTKKAAAVLAEEMRYQGRIITSRPEKHVYAHGWANRNADKLLRLFP